MKELSIVTPVYNNITDTRQFKSEIFKYTQSDFELIIIDNGSSSEMVQLLDSFSKENNITIITNKSNMGFGHANNQGIESANSEYICFLNNDVLLYPGWDSDLIQPFRTRQNVGATGPVTNNCAGEQCSDYGLQDISTECHHVIATKRSKELVGNFREHHRVIGFCLMAETKLIKQIKGFDESFNIGNYEDDDLCIRIALCQKKIIICENAFIYHIGSQTFKSNNINYLMSLNHNEKLFAEKWDVILQGNGIYTYDANRLNKEHIINRNYLTKMKSVSDEFNLTPKCATLGNMEKLKQIKSCNEVVEEFRSLLKIRPFHPEAYLQLIEYALGWEDEPLARYLSKALATLTPKWDIAKEIENSFLKSSCDSLQQPKNWDLSSVTYGNRISVCMIVKDEEHNLGRCLKSIQKIAYQIVVVDTGSSDKTKEIAASYGAEIYDHDWKNDFSEAKNKCLEYAKGDWLLFLDADEELASDCEDALKDDMGQSNIFVYRVPLKNVNSPLTGYNYVPRLVRNAPGICFLGKIHETIHASAIVIMRQWGMEQAMGKTLIYHHGYAPEELARKNKVKRNLAIYEDALRELPDDASIMMNYAHDLHHNGQSDKALEMNEKVLAIFEGNKKEHITPEVREQFIHNYGVFLAQQLKMKELSQLMATRTARDTGPVANVHYMSGLGLMNCNRYEEAIPELEAAIDKAFDETLAPSVPEVRTWKPKHLLANCHASIGNELTVVKLWEEVISECDDSTDPFHDYARYLSTLNRNREALDILLKGLKVEVGTQKIWELGCGIVNKDPELAELSLEWTEDAFKHHPDSDVTKVRRGESLMKNGRFDEAVDYFDDLSKRGERNAIAAQLLCKQLSHRCDAREKEAACGMENEIKEWIEILEKAPCEFDRERAVRLIS